jgi:peptidoglycan/LPS O-acetylase OafA/YrhL
VQQLPKRHLVTIDALRGAFAPIISGAGSCRSFKPGDHGSDIMGWVGVEGFFVNSGFVIPYVPLGEVRWNDAGHFLFKRWVPVWTSSAMLLLLGLSVSDF